MSKKSFVSLAQKVCVVCGCSYANEILIDTRLQDTFEQTTITGSGICPEHKKLFDDGFLALVGVDESKSAPERDGTIRPENAYRTGEIVHIRRTVADQVFNTKLPVNLPMCYVAPEVIQVLKDRMPV